MTVDGTGKRIRIKICGITRFQDADMAAELGADAIGLVFYEASPRRVDTRRTNEIVISLPPFICKVGLFVNPGNVAAAIRKMRPYAVDVSGGME